MSKTTILSLPRITQQIYNVNNITQRKDRVIVMYLDGTYREGKLSGNIADMDAIKIIETIRAQNPTLKY